MYDEVFASAREPAVGDSVWRRTGLPNPPPYPTQTKTPLVQAYMSTGRAVLYITYLDRDPFSQSTKYIFVKASICNTLKTPLFIVCTYYVYIDPSEILKT